MNRPTEGRVLLAGEGNFSLSASLVSSGILSGPQVVASCLDTREVIQDSHRLAASNIALLEEAGTTVLFEVDARELHNHPDIEFFEFSRVVFNFPLADRHNIKKNRALLSEFFNSAVRVLNRQKGEIMVTLCKGQGGTPADQPMRSWHDSWQVVSMATDAGLILTEVVPFKPEEFCKYESVGFRFQDKGFNTDSALIHVFEPAASVQVPENETKRCFIRQNEEDYSVPVYIRHKLDCWSLLSKETHPVAILNQHITTSLCSSGPVLVLPPNDSRLPRVLPGYKSMLSVEDLSATEEMGMSVEDPEKGGGAGDMSAVVSSKELKEMKNRACAASVACERSGRSLDEGSPGACSKSFMHGVDRGGDASQKYVVNATSSSEGGHLTGASARALTSKMFLLPAYVVHKISQNQPSNAAGNFSPMEVDQAEADDSGQMHRPISEELPSEGTQELSCDGNPVPRGTQSLFHLRCSLLENIPDLLSVMKHSAKHKTAITSGIVFRKCPISPVELPASHEALILSQVQGADADDLVNQLCGSLKNAMREDIAGKLQVQTTNCRITIAGHGLVTVMFSLLIQEGAGFSVLGQVFKFDLSELKPDSFANPSTTVPTQSTPSERTIGALLYLDQIARIAVGIPDVRLLWSEDPRFKSQYEKDEGNLLPLSSFKAFSLYPVRFVHDVSFWENPERVFDEAELMDVVRDIADDAVVKMTLVDKFENADMGKTSRCYRLVFQSHDHALSYITSWKLQSMIRLKVAQHLGVTLR